MRRRSFIGAAAAAGTTGTVLFQGLASTGVSHAERSEKKPNDAERNTRTDEPHTSGVREGMIRGTTWYFEKPGPENTEHVIDIVRERIKQGDIHTVVVASTSGKTARKFKNAMANDRVRMVCVTEHAGFKSGDENLFDGEIREELRAAGIPVIQASHVLSGVGRSISQKFGGATPVEIIAHTLRLLGQGVKVAVEISVMAADAGVIPRTVTSSRSPSRGAARMSRSCSARRT
jgi:hypothetical protein